MLFLQTLPWSLGCWSAPFCPESPRLLPALDCLELYDESTNRSGNRRNKWPDQGDWTLEEVHVLPLKRSFALTHYMWTRKTPFCNEELPPWQDQSSISRICSVVNDSQGLLPRDLKKRMIDRHSSRLFARSDHASLKFIVISQTSVRYSCLAVHFNVGVQGRETENCKVKIHLENAPSCCKFRVQAVGGETLRPFESKNGRSRS